MYPKCVCLGKSLMVNFLSSSEKKKITYSIHTSVQKTFLFQFHTCMYPHTGKEVFVTYSHSKYIRLIFRILYNYTGRVTAYLTMTHLCIFVFQQIRYHLKIVILMSHHNLTGEKYQMMGLQIQEKILGRNHSDKQAIWM